MNTLTSLGSVVTKLCLAVLVAGGALLLFDHPTTFRSKSSLSLPDAEVKLWVELRPTHPYLSEYDRVLVATRGESENQVPLFPDTGGYGRLNIYAVGSQRILVRGPHEEFLVHTDTLKIEKIQQPEHNIYKYLAAFAKAEDGTWRFIPASEADEVNVTPQR